MSYTAPPPRRVVKGTQGRVRPPKKHGEPPQEMIESLTLAITQIQDHNASSLSFEEQYRHAYNLVLHRNGHLLYNTVAELISEHLEKEARDKIIPAFPPSTNASSSLAVGTSTQLGSASASGNVAAAAAGQLFLDRVRDLWDDHIACMGKLRDILKYMDKVYTGTSALPAVWDLGLSLFFHHVVLLSTDPKPKTAPKTTASSRNAAPTPAAPLPTTNPSVVAHHLIGTLLTVIRIERQGEVVSRHSIRSITEILSQLVDEGPVPLPITKSAGTGAGTPVLGVGSGANHGRGGTVMGVGATGAQESPYKTSFEKAFLSETREFYEAESKRLLVECDAPSFLMKINRRLDQEATRAQAFLSPSTEPLLISLLEETLIEKHLSAILDHPASGLSSLLQDSRVDDLTRLYRLFGRVSKGHAALQTGISSWIVKIGGQVNAGLLDVVAVEERAGDVEDVPMVNDPKGKGKGKEVVVDVTAAVVVGEGSVPVKKAPKAAVDSGNARTKAALAWVQNVLDLKDKFDVLLIMAFASDKAFEKSINDAFTSFVNQNSKSPEYISLFVDENLKKGLKGKSEAEVDVVLNKTIALFRFLIEKDVFEKYYNNHLAKRLITNRSVSDDAERNMLAKFKIEAGAAFTKSAEGMMKDIKISEDTLAEYKRHQDRPSTLVKAPFDISPIICGQNFWPFHSKDISCNLPEILLKGIEAYRAFYDIKHSGRILTFRPDLGTVDVKVQFKARSHEINLSTHAMVILVLFEDLGLDETLSFLEISNATNMSRIELNRTLQTLACAKYRVLNKTPKGREVNDTDKFSFNNDFSCPLAKIKIQTVVNKVESAEESKETEEKVDEARNTVCDACVVRIMKDRKFLQHTELVNEVINQLQKRFQPRPSMVKKSIERLIEKEYLERDDSDRRQLRYMA